MTWEYRPAKSMDLPWMYPRKVLRLERRLKRFLWKRMGVLLRKQLPVFLR
jgi:hypothetical protein